MQMTQRPYLALLCLALLASACAAQPAAATPEPGPSPAPTQTASPQPMPTEPPEPTEQPAIGSSIISPKDGMRQLYVPAGEFMMGYAEGKADEQPVHAVYLDAYWVDQTEITNRMYLMCVADGVCKQPVQGAHTALRVDSATREFYYGNPEFDDYPVAYVNITQADIYCRWAGRRLPTEAEWEKAARGTDGRLYPWGNEEPNPTLLNFDGNIGDTTRVGSYPAGASPYGALDMAGNMWEWTSDLYDPAYYSHSPYENPTGPASGGVYIERGGSWRKSERPVRSTYRHHYVPPIHGSFINSHNYDGFRCVMPAN